MTIPGNDVSVWQGVIDFTKMRTAGAEFVFIKSTQGNFWDSKFKINHGLSAGIIPRGPYHFYDWTYTYQANVDALVNAYKSYPTELPPVMDYESYTSAPAQSTAAATCLRFLQEVEARTGRTPLLYTSPGYWAAKGSNNAAFAHFPLWIAHYGVSRPTIPAPWSSWVFWQYSSAGDGIKYGASSRTIDMNQGNFATVKDFRIWAGIEAPPPPPPTLEERVAILESNAVQTEKRLKALEAAMHTHLNMPIISK